MLALKLLLVPLFLGLISLAGKRFGPSIAGWLAGLPVVVGPILLLLALQNGATFASDAARFTLASVFTVIAYGVAYAWAARHRSWIVSLGCGFAAWFAAAALVAATPFTLVGATFTALVTLLVAPRLYPHVVIDEKPAALPGSELLLRMFFGAALALAVTTFSESVGPTWSGVASLAPILTPVISVFMHRRSGGVYAIVMLIALARGLYSLAAFCFIVAWQLEALGIANTFALATVVALILQAITLQRQRRRARLMSEPRAGATPASS